MKNHYAVEINLCKQVESVRRRKAHSQANGESYVIFKLSRL